MCACILVESLITGCEDELIQRDEVSLDVFWLRDESLKNAANLPVPDEIASEIIKELRAALERPEAIQLDQSADPA